MTKAFLISLFLAGSLTACSPAAEPALTYDRGAFDMCMSVFATLVDNPEANAIDCREMVDTMVENGYTEGWADYYQPSFSN